MTARTTWAALLGAAIVAVTACAEEEPVEEAGPIPFSTSESAAPTATSPAAVSAKPEAPTQCGDVVSFADVAQALAVPIRGGGGRIYATDFHPDSGRTARLTCTYGTLADVTASPDRDGSEPASGPPIVEINVSTYVDAGAAATRLEGTVSSAQDGGQQVEARKIAGRDGFFLRDKEDVSYVLADGDRTYVVTLLHKVVPKAAEDVVLITLVEKMIGATGASPVP